MHAHLQQEDKQTEWEKTLSKGEQQVKEMLLVLEMEQLLVPEEEAAGSGMQQVV
jgi:hypothetical protein